LDLSKIEAGKLQVDRRKISLGAVRDYVEGTFRQLAEQKGLAFDVQLSSDTPATLNTDSQRLQQILKNLLSNAFKFTERGRIELKIEVVHD
ncbi:sensor histidine kinase, partial [Salmonella sp. SAL4435]|uniref:sensor histidine kinase n=1 Tax=Salmonella sp. SAL4435 TaxID=3159890 RepID=UPI00397A8747